MNCVIPVYEGNVKGGKHAVSERWCFAVSFPSTSNALFQNMNGGKLILMPRNNSYSYNVRRVFSLEGCQRNRKCDRNSSCIGGKLGFPFPDVVQHIFLVDISCFIRARFYFQRSSALLFFPYKSTSCKTKN